jgi:hypothetical protein
VSDPTTTATGSVAPPDWVPVERRLLGMDKATLWPAGLVALLVAVAFWVLPAVDDAVSLDDPVRAGDVVQVGNVAQFDAAAGWNLEAGLRAGSSSSGIYPDQATLTKDGLTLNVLVGDFDGSSNDLLDQIRKNNDKLGPDAVAISTGPPTAIRTADGDRGVVATFTTASSEGLISAFVLDGTGIEITVYGPASLQTDNALAGDVVGMIRSIQRTEGAQS